MIQIVRVGALCVSSCSSDILKTFALGSCIGVTVYDPVARVGGLLHIQLPDSAIDPEKARRQPAAFADTALPLLLDAAYGAGARKHRLIIKAAGGAKSGDPKQQDFFRIGARNVATVQEQLSKSGLTPSAIEFGGTVYRTLSLDIASGSTTITCGGVTRPL